MKEYVYSVKRDIGVSHIPNLENEAKQLDIEMRGLPKNSVTFLKLQKQRRVVCSKIASLKEKLKV